MCSVESLSWHTAASHETIEVDDPNLAELAPINNNNNHKDVQPSDGYDNHNSIKSHTKNGEYIVALNKWGNLHFRWNVKTGSNRQCIQLKIPWITMMISVIQIVVHHIGCDNTINALIFTPTKKHDLWRFFSYNFLHSGPVHLYSNVVLQIFVAIPLETEQGHFRVLAVYFGGVLFGALGSALTNPKQSVVGASAAVYSLLISHISHCILNWSTITHRILRIFAVIVMCCSDIIFTRFYAFDKHSTSIPKISLAAHGCGALAGLLFGFVVFHRSKECNGRFNYYRLISIILVICIIAGSADLLFA